MDQTDRDGAAAAASVAREIAVLIPRLADALLALRPGRVYREALGLVEQALLAHMLAKTGGNQIRAARLLGLNRNTLHKRCRQLGLRSPRPSRAAAAPHA